MPFPTFLRQMKDVMGREPAIFIKALAATCHVEEWGSRVLIKLQQAKREVWSSFGYQPGH